MVGNRDEAFDISQEAFIRVYKSRGKFISDHRFFPWFYSIIANLCRDYLRKRRGRESAEIDIDDCNFLLISESNPETELISKEQAHNLRRALMALDFADREIIMLKHFRELSYDEISATLGIPRGTVMSRLYYARRKLAKMMDEYE
jgi:RNA polymerase sigma-70 factor (ECF subfamily)